MKVMVVAPTPFFAHRGCHVRIFEEIKALKKLGHECVVYTYHLGDTPKGVKVKRIKGLYFYKKKEAGPSYFKILLDLQLRNLVNRDASKFDIIHAHLHEGIFIAAPAAKKYKRPLIADLQGSLTREMIDHGYLKNPIVRSIFASMEKSLLKKPDMMLASSKVMENVLLKEFKINKRKIHLLDDGVDLSKFKKINITGLKKKLGLLNKKIVAYLGVLSKYQGVDNLIKIAKLVQEKDKKIHFLIMGYPKVEYYKEMSKDLGLENVTFTGKIDYSKANDYINLGDIAISLKQSETEANGKLLNYMAAGKPTIATETEVNKSLLGDVGFYVKKGDIKRTADKILKIINSKKMLETVSKKMMLRAKKKFSWNIKGKELGAIYEKTKDKKAMATNVV